MRHSTSSGSLTLRHPHSVLKRAPVACNEIPFNPPSRSPPPSKSNPNSKSNPSLPGRGSDQRSKIVAGGFYWVGGLRQSAACSFDWAQPRTFDFMRKSRGGNRLFTGGSKYGNRFWVQNFVNFISWRLRHPLQAPKCACHPHAHCSLKRLKRRWSDVAKTTIQVSAHR